MSGSDFGDNLSVSEQLAEYDLWLHKRAWQMQAVPNDHEDLVQEGRIAMWKALENHDPDKGALPSWLTVHAQYRMKEVVTRKTWTGMPPRLHGSQSLDHRIVSSLDQLLEDADGVENMLEAADLMDAAIWAYHQGEVAAALDALTPAQRKYVIARFWMGMQNTDLKIVFGYEPHALWTSKKNGARMKLRDRLAHLVSVD